MENKIMFLLIAIILIYLLFTKAGISMIKKVIGVTSSSSSNDSSLFEDTGTPTDKVYSGGGSNSGEVAIVSGVKIANM